MSSYAGRQRKREREADEDRPLVPVMAIYTKKWSFLGLVPDRGTRASLKLGRERWGAKAVRTLPELQ